MEGPSKADIQCEDNDDGTCQVKYMPTEPGNYVVNIKFADEHIKGLFNNGERRGTHTHTRTHAQHFAKKNIGRKAE